jgi:hypothetical protein
MAHEDPASTTTEKKKTGQENQGVTVWGSLSLCLFPCNHGLVLYLSLKIMHGKKISKRKEDK